MQGLNMLLPPPLMKHVASPLEYLEVTAAWLAMTSRLLSQYRLTKMQEKDLLTLSYDLSNLLSKVWEPSHSLGKVDLDKLSKISFTPQT